MSEHLQTAIDEIVAKIKFHQQEITDLKIGANALCKIMGTSPLYPDPEPDQPPPQFNPSRPDQFYGKPLATAVREFLEYRNQACKTEEILKALEAGAFDFDALGWKKEGRLRSLSMSLAKNTTMFHKLPESNLVGLTAWYQETIAKKKGRVKADNGTTPEPAVEAIESVDDSAKTIGEILAEEKKAASAAA